MRKLAHGPRQDKEDNRIQNSPSSFNEYFQRIQENQQAPTVALKYAKLEQELKRLNLIQSDSIFVQLFSIEFNSTIPKVNWLGKNNALIYLFFRMKEESLFHFTQSVYKFASERFLIRNKGVESRNLNSAMITICKKYRSGKAKKPLPDYLEQIERIILSLKNDSFSTPD